MLGALVIQPAATDLETVASDGDKKTFLEQASIASDHDIFALSSLMKRTVLSGSLGKAGEGAYSYHVGLTDTAVSVPEAWVSSYTISDSSIASGSSLTVDSSITSDLVFNQPPGPHLVKLTTPTVRLDSSTSASNIQCSLNRRSSLDPDMVGHLEMALHANGTINKSDFERKAKIMTQSELKVICGDRVPDSVNFGCMWNKKDLLESTFRQGIHHTRKGVPRSNAFSLYAHAQFLISSRSLCTADSPSDFVSIPFNYEALYGVMSAKISAIAKRLDVQMAAAPLNDEQMKTLDYLTQQALALKPEGVVTFTESFFPTSAVIPDPIPVPVQTKTLSRSNPLSLSVRNTAFSSVTSEFCGSEHFKYEFMGPNLSDPEQHCCDEGCSLISAFLSGGNGIYAGLGPCCGLCNKMSCHLSSNEEDTMIISGGSIVTITSVSNGETTIIYFSI